MLYASAPFIHIYCTSKHFRTLDNLFLPLTLSNGRLALFIPLHRRL